MYNIPPYMEEQALHDLDKGLAEGSASKKGLGRDRVQTPVAWGTCPSRRPVIRFRSPGAVFAPTPKSISKDRCPRCKAARADYCANASDLGGNQFGGGPGSYGNGDSGYAWRDTRCPTGANRLCVISFERSTVRLKDVTDGVSKVYLVGEKYLNNDKYGTGSNGADD